MSGRDLVDEMRSGIRPVADVSRRSGLFDILIAAIAVVALGALGFVAYGTWFSDRAPRPPVQVAAAAVPAQPVAWTEEDSAACKARGRSAANDPDTGTYLITNRSISEGVAGLATRVECELTAKPRRFCGTEGGGQVAAIVNDYINRMDLIRLGLAAQGAPMAFAGGLLGGEAAAGDAVYDAMKADTLAYMKQHDARVVKALRTLASGGIVTKEAFRPFPFAGVPARIEELFAGIEVKSSLCG